MNTFDLERMLKQVADAPFINDPTKDFVTVKLSKPVWRNIKGAAQQLERKPKVAELEVEE